MSEHKDESVNKIKEFLASPKIGIKDILDKDLKRYELAFKHRSVEGVENSYERLEWLGDRVLNLVVSTYLYKNCEKDLPNVLSKKLECVSNDNLQKVILKDSIFSDNIIQTRKGTSITPNIRADVFEAFIGAIYLHKGFSKAENVVISLFAEGIESFDPEKNYKGRLQEKCQKLHLPIPEYCLEKTEGYPPDQTFHCSVKVWNKKKETGIGPNKPDAEKEAAKKLLDNWDLPSK